MHRGIPKQQKLQRTPMHPPYFVMPISQARGRWNRSPSAFFVSRRSCPLRQKGRDIMRMFKTAADNRTDYKYYPENGSPITITPAILEEAGCENPKEIIVLIHSMDDEEVDANRREQYHAGVYFNDGDDWLQRQQNNAVDKTTSNMPRISESCYDGREWMKDPLEQILNAVEEQIRSDRLDRLKKAVSDLTDLQKATIFKKFNLEMTNVAIAAEEGVSEAAIRNRLKKIYENIRKKI